MKKILKQIRIINKKNYVVFFNRFEDKIEYCVIYITIKEEENIKSRIFFRKIDIKL